MTVPAPTGDGSPPFDPDDPPVEPWYAVRCVIRFADGGPTTVDNGCLLCRSCHTAVHHSGWDVVMGHDRHPWLIPPASIDPLRRPLPAYNRRTLRLDDRLTAA